MLESEVHLATKFNYQLCWNSTLALCETVANSEKNAIEAYEVKLALNKTLDDSSPKSAWIQLRKLFDKGTKAHEFMDTAEGKSSRDYQERCQALSEICQKVIEDAPEPLLFQKMMILMGHIDRGQDAEILWNKLQNIVRSEALENPNPIKAKFCEKFSAYMQKLENDTGIRLVRRDGIST